jgi:hypothetical protein
LFGTTVVLRGIADTSTLRDISALAGDREVDRTSISHSVDRWGRLRPSTTVSSNDKHRLPVDAVAHGTPGRALVLGMDKTIREVTLTPAHASSPWRELLPQAQTRDQAAVRRLSPPAAAGRGR